MNFELEPYHRDITKEQVVNDITAVARQLGQSMNWYSHSGHLEKSDIENKLIEVRDDNRKKELFKAI